MHEYKVLSNQKITTSTLLLTLEKSPTAKPFNFAAGQYATISFKKNGRPTPVRCFSMVNSPRDQTHLQFSVRIFGNYTKAVSELKVGEIVQVLGPFGGFVIDENRDQDIVMLAGGIGITPLISIVHYVSNLQLPNKIKLIYSVRDQNDIPFIKQLNDLASANPNFSVSFVIGDGSTDKITDSQVYSGRITSNIISDMLNNSYEGKKFFICGPSQFMSAMSKILKSDGVDSSHIVTESFRGGPNGQPGNVRSWPFNIYVFGAVGVVLASAVVMLSDLISNLPANSMLGTSSLIDNSNSTNSRQTQLDNLVNSLPANTSSSSTTTTTTTSTTTTAPATTTKCTTTQSGVTTCI